MTDPKEEVIDPKAKEEVAEVPDVPTPRTNPLPRLTNPPRTPPLPDRFVNLSLNPILHYISKYS